VLTEEIPLPSVLGQIEKLDMPKASKGHLLATLERLRDDVERSSMPLSKQVAEACCPAISSLAVRQASVH
jgi:hypothetical protein